MKKSLFFVLMAGLLLAAGISGYRALHRNGAGIAGTPAQVAAPNLGTVAIPEAAKTVSAVAPRAAVSKQAVRPPEQPLQVVSAPGDRFQPIDKAQILDQRVTTVSKDRKKRELLVKAAGKYPFRRVEETLTQNDGAETCTIVARTEMVANHVLVKLQAGKTEEDLQAMLKSYGVAILRELTLPGHYIVSLKAPTLDAVPEALSVFSGEAELLAYVEPDYFSYITAVPNDTRWSDLWGMRKINATGAWDVTTGSTNVSVAVIDTGIDLTHPDLVANLWKNAAEANGTAGVDDDGNGYIDDVNGWDFVNNDKTPADDNSHGTHCAGTIGAVGNNSNGVAGVCWKVRLMALKAGDADGALAYSDLVDAVRYAADKGAKVISASYGSTGKSDTERDAIVYANSKGVLFVAAAGNDGVNNDLTPFYPAGYDVPNIVSVAATDQNDALASFSNYGKTSVDLTAPGVGIYSTIPGGNIDSKQGTSMATPHVAGAAALLLSAKPTLTHLQLKEALLNTVDALPALAAKTVSGGRLNVKKLIALQDSDNDGMPDDWELANGLNPNNPFDATLDPDNDHLNNRGEYENRCNPNLADTDTDTLVDGWEVTYGFNPNSSTGGLAASSSLGAFGISGGSKNVSVVGNYAYVAAGSAGLVIVNISSPESPVLAGSYTAKTANDVTVSNGYAYVASGGNTDRTNGLLVLNVSNPALPTRSGFLKTAGTARGVAVQGSYAYLADGSNELVVINVSNPASPSQAGKVSGTIRNFADVFVSGSSAYVAMNEDVKRFNVSNPASPALNSAASGGFVKQDVFGVHGNGAVLAVAVGTNGVSLLNPNTADGVVMPKLISGAGLYDTDGTASGVFVSGNYVYVADGANGLVVLDITNPSAPAQVVQIATAGLANGVFVSGDKVYVATSTGLEVLSILPDTDADGLPNSWEMTWFGNLLQNGTNDFDHDEISNWGEYLAGLNPTNADQDADGLIDGTQEVRIYNTDPRMADTDGDGLTDGDEVSRGTDPVLKDTDGDGMNDGWEVHYGFNPLDILDPGPSGDVDLDGLTNLEESQNGTNPNNRDTDGDGMWDGWEVRNGLDPLVNDAALDPDSDGLNNLKEFQLGTNPKNSDSDGDTMPDGWEYTYMPPLNPTNSLDALLDSDLDGLINKFEYSNGCNPTNPDTDADGMPDGWEIAHGLLPTSATGANGASGDPDGDKLLNLQEYSLISSSLWQTVYTSVTGAPATFFFGPPLGTPGMPGSTDPMDTDSDNDSLSDYYEITLHTGTNVTGGITNIFTYVTNPNNPDTDGDGFSDSWEIANGFNPIFIEDPAATDRDHDGFTDAEEIALGTQPNNRFDPVCVDDDAINDPWPMDPQSSDPLENGSRYHPFDAIQEAINTNTTVNGMTILVTNGTYLGEGNYNIDTHGKAIRIISWNNDPANTIVNSLGYGPVFTLSSGETTNTVIKGLGITVTLNPCSDGDCDTEHGVVLSNASPRIENCRIFDCELNGIHCVNNSSPVIKDCQVSNVRNGIWCVGGSSPRIENCTVSTIGHDEAGDVGIGIYADSSSGLYVGNTTVSDCNGRGIVLKDSANATIETSTLIENGGGITCDNSSPRIDRCVVRDNDAPNYYTVNGYQFVGPIIFPYSSTNQLEDIKDTTDEDENGGGILMLRGSSPFIVNSLIINNRTWADDPDYSEAKLIPDFGLGGALYIGAGCSPTGVNCTVANNHANTRGGGISSFQSPFLRNMIFWGNTSSNATIVKVGTVIVRFTSSNSIYRNLHCRSGSINIWYSDIEGGYPSATLSTTNNPLFIGGGDYHFSSTNSPCYNSGTFALAPTNDLDGIPRPTALPQKVDMGCYEGIGSGGGGGGGGGSSTDADGDGMPDSWELANGLNLNDPLDAALDPDSDGLTNLQEYQHGTNPRVADTDGDGFLDGFEVANGFNPLVAENPAITDHDQDGITDAQEIALGTNPANGRDPVWVDDNATSDPMPGEPNISNPNENGSTNYPFDSIQEAIDTNTTVSGMTIFVKGGTYAGTGNFDITPRGKALRILSVNGSSNTFIITHAYGSAFMINSGETTNTIIRGFTIETQGDLAPEEGVVVSGASPVLQDLVIHNCELEAVSCINGAAPKILNCRFYGVPNGLYANGSAGVLLQQSVISNTSGRGIVILNDNLAQVTWSTIENCAGGITLNNSDASIRQCIIRNNDAPNYYTVLGFPVAAPVLFNLGNADAADTTSSDENGAGILILNGSSPLLQNCLIVGNTTWADDPAYSESATEPSFGLGAGIYIGAGCSPTGVNCTVADNHASTRGGGISSAGRPLFRNMILWGNTSSNATIVLGSRSSSLANSSIYLADEVINIWYSDIQGGYANEVLCINSNPQFVGGGNYSLQGGSPCINEGTFYLAPVVDLVTNSRPTITDYDISSTNRVDMGCYEYGTTAVTNSSTLEAQIPQKDMVADPLADTDGDGFKDSAEIIAGTDMYNSGDYFCVNHEQIQKNGPLLVKWQTTPGCQYTVQTTTNLLGTWSNVSGCTNMPGTGAEMRFTGTMTNSARYYRIQVRRN